MTKQTTADENATALPVACALTSADLAAQTGRWQQLAARAMTGRADTSYGLRMCLRPAPGVEEELRTLVAVENECCPWADWTVRASAGQLLLDVRSAGAGIATLHTMFTSLRPAQPENRPDAADSAGAG
jgi:hypothetical protein